MLNKILLFISLFLLLSASSCEEYHMHNLRDFNTRPDEFSVSKNKELIIPQNFNLPKPTIDSNKVTNKKFTPLDESNLTAAEKNLLKKSNQYRTDEKIYNKLEQGKKPNLLQRLYK